MQEKAKEPEIRFAGFTGAWEQRKFSKLYKRSSEKNDGSIGIERNITVATMQFKSDIRLSSDDYLKTYFTFKVGDIAFEGHQSKEFRYGRFVENDIGDGVVSHIFTVFRPIQRFDLHFWKYAINSENLMQKILSRSTKASTMMHDLVPEDFLNETFLVPSIDEQKAVGKFLHQIDNLLTLHQRKYEKLLNIKKSMLEKMFPKEGEVVPEIRFKGFTGAWEQRKFGEMANRRSEVSASGNLPRVEYEDIVSGTGTLNKDVFEKQSQKQGIVFHSGDVLYGKLRPYLQNWLLASFNGLAVGDFWVLEPQGLNSNYLYRIIQTKQFDEIANQSVGTKMPRADWKLVSKATFLNPASFNEQRLIGKFFKDIDSLLTLHQRKLEMLKNVKQAFLEKMFV